MNSGKITVATAATFQRVKSESFSDVVFDELDVVFSSFSRENQLPIVCFIILSFALYTGDSNPSCFNATERSFPSKRVLRLRQIAKTLARAILAILFFNGQLQLPPTMMTRLTALSSRD